jgi:hypothetical protein
VGLLLAWLISAVVFGLLHGANPHATPLAVANILAAGLMLGLAYLLTGRLGLPIGLHIAWNLFQGHVYGLAVSGRTAAATTVLVVDVSGPALWTGGAFGPEASLLSLVTVMVGCLLIWLRARVRYPQAALAVRLEPSIPPRHSRTAVSAVAQEV